MKKDKKYRFKNYLSQASLLYNTLPRILLNVTESTKYRNVHWCVQRIEQIIFLKYNLLASLNFNR